MKRYTWTHSLAHNPLTCGKCGTRSIMPICSDCWKIVLDMLARQQLQSPKDGNRYATQTR